MRKVIMVQKHVAITLCKLATSDSYRSVVGKSTAGTLVMKICKAFIALLQYRVAALGNIPKIIIGFEWMGFLSCAGAYFAKALAAMLLAFKFFASIQCFSINKLLLLSATISCFFTIFFPLLVHCTEEHAWLGGS